MTLTASTADASYRGTSVPWWLPVLALGVVTAAVAYVAGILAARGLGARMASFAALLEVLFAVVFAWLLLGSAPARRPAARRGLRARRGRPRQARRAPGAVTRGWR